MSEMNKYTTIVIGGGAAGLQTAIEAGKRGAKVLLIEHNKQVGNKILISGGGRCNFTNINARPENYISSNPHFIKSSFSEYTPQDFISLVEKHGIEYYEKKLGQLFCKKSSRSIVNMLLGECDAFGVEIRTSLSVREIRFNDSRFVISTDVGEFISKTCVIATGGLSFPKKGATDFGYRIAKQFGHSIIKLRPGLVPIELEDENTLLELKGISFDSITYKEAEKGKSGNKKTPEFRENTLITHRGLSGPAILQITNYTDETEPFAMNMLPQDNVGEILNRKDFQKKSVKNTLSLFFPNQLAEFLARETSTLEKTVADLSNDNINRLESLIHSLQVVPIGTEGYPKAEVTVGGVNTNELNQKTMESKLQQGLFFVGEVVDVTGWLGGYNFQWAWASGYVCGRYIGDCLNT
ncbi:MAG: NAD(P)/FAD-dependent oxidoreductase [Candidatus Kapaibacteriales bacterium]